jgi:hypothetical protein
VAGTIVKKFWPPGLGRYLVRHPASAVTLARAGWRLRRGRWLRHSPFLPLPAADYWHFRMVTANGSAATAPSPASMLEAATWAMRQPPGRS